MFLFSCTVEQHFWSIIAAVESSKSASCCSILRTCFTNCLYIQCRPLYDLAGTAFTRHGCGLYFSHPLRSKAHLVYRTGQCGSPHLGIRKHLSTYLPRAAKRNKQQATRSISLSVLHVSFVSQIFNICWCSWGEFGQSTCSAERIRTVACVVPVRGQFSLRAQVSLSGSVVRCRQRRSIAQCILTCDVDMWSPYRRDCGYV